MALPYRLLSIAWFACLPTVAALTLLRASSNHSAVGAQRQGNDDASCNAVAVRNRAYTGGVFKLKRWFEMSVGMDSIVPFPKNRFRGLYLWDFFVPNITCPDMDRFGRPGDGGKWVCGVDNLVTRDNARKVVNGFPEGADPPCTIFSYGVGYDGSFEQEFLKTVPGCVVHSFDPTNGDVMEDLKLYARGGAEYFEIGKHPRYSWHKVGLAGQSGGNQQSGLGAFPLVENLTDSMRRVGVSYVDILKIDVEGAEYDALIPLLRSRTPGVDPPLFGQLLIKMHANAEETSVGMNTTAFRVFELMDLLGEHGYWMFAKEASLITIMEPKFGGLPTAMEYSFIHTEAWQSRAAAVKKLTYDALQLNIKRFKGEITLAPPTEIAPPPPTKVSGVLYFLTQAKRLHLLRKAIEDLHNNFNVDYRYPLFVFHEGISRTEQDALRNEVVKNLYELRFVDVADIWARPLPLPMNLSEAVPQRCRCSVNSSTIGYRRMIHFQGFLAMEMLHQDYGFEWMWRLDDDSSVQSLVGYDPFQLMVANKWKYATVNVVADEPACVEGIWDLANSFVASKQAALPHGPAFYDQMLPGVAFYNNFEISHYSVWESPIYQQWKQAVLDHGGIFTRRWGDAVIHAIGVSLALAQNEVHYFSDLGYKHGLLDQKATSLATSGMRQYWFYTMGYDFYPVGFHFTGPMRYMPLTRFTPPLLLPDGSSDRDNKLINFNVGASTSVKGGLHDGVLYSVLSKDFASTEDLTNLLRSFGDNFLIERPYPLILFCVAGDEVARTAAEAAVRDVARHYAEAGLLRNASFPAHSLVYGDGSAAQFGIPIEGGTLPFPVRLWAMPGSGNAGRRLDTTRIMDILAFENGYDWLWRIDPAGALEAPVREDLFDSMLKSGARFGYSARGLEEPSAHNGRAWEKARDYIQHFWQAAVARELAEGNVSGRLPLVQNASKVLLLQGAADVQEVFHAGCEISHASVWASPATRSLLLHFGRIAAENDAEEHWSDSLLHTLAVLATATRAGELRELTDLPYDDPRYRKLLPDSFVEVGPSKHGRPERRFSLQVRSPLPSAINLAASGGSTEPSAAVAAQSTQDRQHAVASWRVMRLEPVGWVGGIVGASVMLPPSKQQVDALPQRVWLLGDSLLGSSRRGSRTHIGAVVHQAVGRSDGTAFLPSRFDWGLTEDSAGNLETDDIFSCGSGNCFYRPVAGLGVVKSQSTSDGAQDVQLVLLAERKRKTSAETSVHSLLVVRNPREPAAQWRWEAADLPGDYAWAGDLASTDGAEWAQDTGHVYLLGVEPRDGTATLARIGAADLLNLSLNGLEVLKADSHAPTWQPVASVPAGQHEALFGVADQEYPLFFSREINAWVTASLVNGGHAIAVRMAATPEGPWGPSATVAVLSPELVAAGRGEGARCFAPKLHAAAPGQSQAPANAPAFVVSVVCGPPTSTVLTPAPTAGESTFGATSEQAYIPRFFDVYLSSQTL